MWIASIKWFMERQCRVWFTQVLSSACYPGNFFIPIHSVSRVVYSHHLVNFGRFIGEEKVYIITPFEFLIDKHSHLLYMRISLARHFYTSK